MTKDFQVLLLSLLGPLSIESEQQEQREAGEECSSLREKKKEVQARLLECKRLNKDRREKRSTVEVEDAVCVFDRPSERGEKGAKSAILVSSARLP